MQPLDWLKNAIFLHYFLTELKTGKKILVAPLDWGLGHATRVIPIIRELQQQGAEVLIGSDGRSLSLLRNEFPEVRSFRIPGYDVHYGTGKNLGWIVAFQLPKIIMAILKEHQLLAKMIEDERIDAVISDNRYGLFSKKVMCILITHQVNIKLPFPFKWASGLIQQVNHYLINRFDVCWIPDSAGTENLSGDLSHGSTKPKNATFIGPLSRFTFREVKRQYSVLMLLSGPEPQRTIFEELLTQEINKYIKLNHKSNEQNNFRKANQQNMLMVRGVTESALPIQENTGLFVKVDYLLSEELNTALLAADIIVARPGYSTIMDLSVLGSRVVFIPTPGQPEQEYLASYLMQKGYCYATEQQSFSLEIALEKIKSIHGQKAVADLKWKLSVKELLSSVELP